MNPTRPDVSIVIITWRARHHLERCLASLDAGGVGCDHEIIVVDNGSEDGTVELVRERFGRVELIENGRNLGVARARNRGLRRARGRHAMILDVDTEVPEGAIDRLVAYLDRHPRVGLVGPRLVSPDGSVQRTARRFHNALTPVVRRLDRFEVVARGREMRRFLMLDTSFEGPRRVDHVIGAAQMVRRRALDRAGLLDERMFYGWEDTELCVRLHRLGYEVHYDPETVIVHHEQRMSHRSLLSAHVRAQLWSMAVFFRTYPRGLWGDYR